MSEIDDLRRKLAARKGRPGFKENCDEIEARIALLGRVDEGSATLNQIGERVLAAVASEASE